MYANKNIISIIGLLGVFILASLIIISACDTRRINDSVENQKVELSFNPNKLVVYSPDKLDTIGINISVRDVSGVAINNCEVTISRTPEIGTIIPAGLTVGGIAQAFYITDPQTLNDSGSVIDSVKFTAIVNGVSVAAKSIGVLFSDPDVSIEFNPANLVINSVLELDTIDININVTGVDSVNINNIEVNVTRTPEIGTIIQAGLTVNGYAQALYIADPEAIANSEEEIDSITFTVTVGEVDFTKSISVSLLMPRITMNFTPNLLVVYSPYHSDTVDIDINVLDSNGVAIDGCEVVISRTPEVGIIIPAGLTENGHAHALFISDSQILFNPDSTIDSLVFSAFIGGESIATKSLYVLRSEPEISISFNPINLIISSAFRRDTIDININVQDEMGSNIDNIEVNVEKIPEFGTIIPPALTENGYTKALYITDPEAMINSPEESDSIAFTVTVGETSFTRSIDVTISLPEISMSFRPNVLVVYSANEPDTVEIDLFVRDNTGMGIDSIEVAVTRAPEVGTIIPPELTENGYANALYITDPGVISDPDENIDSLIFTATTGEATVVRSLDVLLSLQGEIANMNISAQKIRLTANGTDNTKIFVSATDTTGGPIGNNTLIYIENYGAVNPGFFNQPFGNTVDGIVEFTLTAPFMLDPETITEVDSICAWSVSLSGDTTHAYTALTYQPDDPFELFIPPDSIPDSLFAGSNEDCLVWVRVIDEYGSLVLDGTQVQFKIALESSSISNLATTENGWAQGVYTVGTESGHESIQAFIPSSSGADTIWSIAIDLEVISGTPTNIDLYTNRPTIQVGGYATTIRAVMQDENGNPLSSGYLVRFEITASPASSGTDAPSFNFVSTVDTCVQVDSTETNIDGEATIALFSGTKAGTVRIKATSIDDENIFKEQPIVTIQSGPPYRIEIAPSNIAEIGEEGQALKTGITALVWDEFTNPVECSTAVHFEVIPDTIAYIEGAAYTGGGIDDDGETLGTRGQAYTWMAYSCLHTFDTVRVETSSGVMADTSGPIILAIYEGLIVVYPTPGYLFVSPPPDYEESDIEARLLDGLGCYIHNGVINFTVRVCGQISGQTVDTTDYDGYAFTTFRIYDYQIPVSPPDPPQCIAVVNAKLRGYPDVEGECQIYCAR